jgi:hypothetical protein
MENEIKVGQLWYLGDNKKRIILILKVGSRDGTDRDVSVDVHCFWMGDPHAAQVWCPTHFGMLLSAWQQL